MSIHYSDRAPLVTLELAIVSVILTLAVFTFKYLSYRQPPETPPQQPQTSHILGMAYTTVQNKAIADFRAITNVDKTTAARVLKANSWNVTQTVNRYPSYATTHNGEPDLKSSSFYSNPSAASASPSRGGLGKLFDKYRGSSNISAPTWRSNSNTA